MSITIRPADDSDISAMAEIRAAESRDKTFWTDRIARYMRGEHSPQQALQERAVFVAIDDETVVGFVAGHRTRRFDCDGELQWINVGAGKRGQGIADKLVARIGTWFVEQSAYRICVNVDSQNVAARRVYARCGVRPLSEGWMVWGDARSVVGGIEQRIRRVAKQDY